MQEDNKYKVIVAHPGKQHSFKTATALYEKGMLFNYITTVYDKPGSITHFANKLLTGSDKKKAKSRRSDTLPDSKVYQFFELYGLINIFLPRLKFLSKYKYWWNNWLNDRFGKKVAKYAIKNNVDAVISYDYNSLALFEYLKAKAPHIKRILDVSIANRIYAKDVFQRDVNKTGETGVYSENLDVWEESSLNRVKNEIDLASHFLVPSQIVKESLIFSGVEDNRISVVPYGVNTDQFSYVKKQTIHKPLKLLYVGGIIYRKGIHHLLNIAEILGPDVVDINLVGKYDTNSCLYKRGSKLDNVRFLGFLTHDVLFEQYRESDFFIFPSLCEGYALVMLEAQSCGMPIICSDHSGGNDDIINGFNGYVFPATDDEALIKCIKKIISNPDCISYMSENARETASKMTWEAYNSLLIDTVIKILNKASYEITMSEVSQN
ncbi:glycosyltransferase family 4 protein [Clostridium manihotivorum]|uniref:Glycosyl transferase family 1 domain-containing protein n=1 Tax=Clostridium manihotivorum TaxID=2320868 RepID=A0A3R5UBG3_9CLOT|nr:glycosyltransferase family 4 protein [Clostridium manihotivorum]QAA34731.1 hypothetical protein C1I91_25565 [Clostridium manihotivorum]